MLNPKVKDCLSRQVHYKTMFGILNNLDIDEKIEALLVIFEENPLRFKKLIDMNYITNEELKILLIKDYYVFKIIKYSDYNEEILNILKEYYTPTYDFIYDFLPDEIASLTSVKELFNRNAKIYSQKDIKDDSQRDQLGYDRNWKDENGNLINFGFTLYGDFQIKSKEDYYKLVQTYIKSGNSVASFCKKYGISSINGFEKLLERVDKETKDVGEDISQTKIEVSHKFIEHIKEIGNKLANDLSFEVYFKDYFKTSHSLKTIIRFSSSEEQEIILSKFNEYIQNNSKNLPMHKINMFAGNNNNFNIITNNLTDIISTNVKNPDLRRKLTIGAKRMKQLFQKYNIQFSRNNSYMHYTINGCNYDINDDIIDQALAYIDENDMYRCQYTVNEIAKKIAMKEIAYKNETDDIMEQMRIELLELIKENKTIEEYLKTMEENNSKKR